MSHNGSAMWVFDLQQAYRPGSAISNNAWLIAYDLDDTAATNIRTRGHIDFENAAFAGEAAHAIEVIVKSNEPGAYGIGRMRQGITSMHVTARFAKKKEVAKALGLKEQEIGTEYRPGTTWPV
ncbi:hypothetical protein GCM10007973_21830 [Polymorphobacter multimanifer]|nr:hypothetical protein GCM10007973_21830 [Polymorphobacter multimanifer]